MANEPGQPEKPQITSNKEQPIIVNFAAGMPNPLDDKGGWIPHRYAVKDGKSIIASWRWEEDARKGPILDEKLEKLEEEKIKKDPSYYERRRIAHMSPNEEKKYKDRKRFVWELARLKNNEKQVPLSREIIDQSLNIDDEGLDEVKKEIVQFGRARKSVPRQNIKPRFFEGTNAGIISEAMEKRDEQKEENYRKARELAEESKHEQV